ncbi:efflux RND transporter periplasmic adaptor subunit [Methylocapsa acidiphila]|uniref:efflux RND transporter periplasmic adaptor subunit n=1 Tax=Methylocapsa acidiphila TaxID=133552 RepID=UPI0031580581
MPSEPKPKRVSEAMERAPGAHWGRQAAMVSFALLCFGGGWFYWAHYGGGARRGPVPSPAGGSRAGVVTALGTLAPAATTPVAARVSGPIQALYCDRDTRVTAGQICAKIDPRPYQSEVDRARTDLAAAEARLEKERAEAERAKSNLDRAEARAERRAISHKAFAKAREGEERARARIELGEQEKAKRATTLAAAESALGKTAIVVPTDGLVVARGVEIGQLIDAAAQTPLFQIAADLSVLRIEAKVEAKDIGAVKIGDQAEFTIDRPPSRTFSGAVMQIRPSPEAAKPASSYPASSYEVIIAAPNPDLALAPGMKAAVSIMTERPAPKD